MFGMNRELSRQLERIKIIAHTERGKLVVTDQKPRIFRKSWKRVVVGYSDEPWDPFTMSKTSVKVELEKIGGISQDSEGRTINLPNWYIAQVSLSGWYPLDVFINGKLVMSKPQVSIWERLDEVQPGYCLFKLGEHQGIILPWYLRVRWMIKWSFEYYASLSPAFAKIVREKGWIEKLLGI